MENTVAEQKRQRAAIWREWERAGVPTRFYGFTLEGHPSKQHFPGLVARLTRPPEPPGEGAGEEEWDAHSDRCGDFSHSWYLWGPFGTGKTGLAVGFAREYLRHLGQTESISYLEAGLLVRFVSVPRLLGELRATYGNSGGSESEVLWRYMKVDLLILDDLGSESISGSGWVEDRLFQIVSHRHGEMKLTVYTSNLSLDQQAARLGPRIVWRIAEDCAGHIVKVDGPNLRLPPPDGKEAGWQ